MYSNASNDFANAIRQNVSNTGNSNNSRIEDYKKKIKDLNERATAKYTDLKADAISSAKSKVAEAVGVDEKQAQGYLDGSVAVLGSRPAIQFALTKANVAGKQVADRVAGKVTEDGALKETNSLNADPKFDNAPVDNPEEGTELGNSYMKNATADNVEETVGKKASTEGAEDVGKTIAKDGAEDIAENVAEDTVATGLFSAGAVEIASGVGVIAGLATLGVGAYEMFHKSKHEVSKPILPTVPVAIKANLSKISNVKNTYVSPSFDSVVDVAGSSSAF